MNRLQSYKLFQPVDYQQQLDNAAVTSKNTRPAQTAEEKQIPENNQVLVKMAQLDDKAQSLEKLQLGFEQLVRQMMDINAHLDFQVVQRDGSVKDINVAALSSQPFTFAAAYNSSNSAGSVYGLIASNEGLSLNNFTGVDIGRRVGGTPCNGHISSVRYYRTRLSNAQLQSLTT